MNLKNVLITLASVAVVLGIISFYVVFYGSGGTYVVTSPLGSSTGLPSSSTIAIASGTASSTPSSTLTISSSTGTSSIIMSEANEPPITWQEGNEMMSVTGASLSGTELTLDVQVAMGQVSECVPMNMRIVTDENGDLAAPLTPQFSFPDTGTCSGTPGETYADQQVVFTVPTPIAYPFILTSGGISNVLFEINADQSGNLIVSLPPQED